MIAGIDITQGKLESMPSLIDCVLFYPDSHASVPVAACEIVAVGVEDKTRWLLKLDVPEISVVTVDTRSKCRV